MVTSTHSADGWKALLAPVIARCAQRDVTRLFRADAAFAIPALYETLETAGYFYAIRLKKNAVLEDKISHRLTRPEALFPRLSFIVTNLSYTLKKLFQFYNQRGTAERHIKEGKNAITWTRLSCKRFCDNAVRLQLHALAYNLGVFLHGVDLPEESADWPLSSIQSRLIKIGARVVCHARKITFQLAEVAVRGTLFGQIIAAIRTIKPPPRPA
jgi:hypothetical protein